MQRSLRLSLAALGKAALSFASLPAVSAKPAEVSQGTVNELGVITITLKDIVKPQIGIQAQSQAAGTPNQAGLGGFLPLMVGSNSVFFADILANANFADINNSSSIVNTTVAGVTLSTSSRLGYRWLNSDRSWMYGLNAGYDTRPMSTGPTDTGIPVNASRTAFFQQAAVNAEAIGDKWTFNAYALLPTGTTNAQLNTTHQGGALGTFGLDAGYNLNKALRVSIGYYYQNGDLNTADGSGVLGHLTYAINNDLTVGADLSYDNTFKSRFSTSIKWRFSAKDSLSKEGQANKSNYSSTITAPIAALTSTPTKRNVRVHDTTVGIQVLGVPGFD